MAEFEDEVGVNSTAQQLCNRMGSAARTVVGPFGLLVLASKDLNERTAVFFQIVRYRTELKLLMCRDQSRSSLLSAIDKTTYGTFVNHVGSVKEKSLSLRVLVSMVTLREFGQWLANHSLDELIECTSSHDIPPTTDREDILHFIEKRDIVDNERRMWGLLYTYHGIFREANILLYCKTFTGMIMMGGPNQGSFPNLHKFWEMIVGKKIFSSQLRLSPLEVHPEVRALLKTQMILLLEYVGLTRNEALVMIEQSWWEELRVERDYLYGHYWETTCSLEQPRRLSLDVFNRNGRIWDAAEEKWYAGVRRIYQEEITVRAVGRALDSIPRPLGFLDPPKTYEPASIDVYARLHENADWFNEDDVERSAQQLWCTLTFNNEWPGWDEARRNYQPVAHLDIPIPLIPRN